MTDQNKYWFKPKTHGYGAAPTNAKGWAVVLGFVAFVIVLSHVTIVQPAIYADGPSTGQLISFAVLLGVGVFGFVRFTRAKTDGVWKWRWGDR